MTTKSFYFLFLFLPYLGYSQTVSVNDTPQTALDLTTLLFDNGCAELSNASYSSNESVTSFDNNGGDFPISEGIILRSGTAKFSEGPYTGNNLSSQQNTQGDPDLQEINDASGQSSNITDVAYLQFDFIPLFNQFSFDFLFASNEYGQWQCVSTDAFAFLLTNLDTGETTNLAVIPNTTTPISVKNIREDSFNGSCSAQNPDFFDVYNVTNPANSTINMRGYTVMMNAASTVVPGNAYRIRLVIGDSNDADFDSAIFLDGGSFGTSIDLGGDHSICEGNTDVIETGLDSETYTHVWTRNGQEIPNENGSSLTISQTGTYGVVVTKIGTNCTFSDEVTFDDLFVQTPQDIEACNNGSDTYAFNLTQNDVEALDIDPAVYQVFYYASENDAQSNTPIPENQLTEYMSAGNETIYIKIFDTTTGKFCDAEYPFELLVNSEINVVSPDPIKVCFSFSGYTVDLTQVNDQVLDGQTANDFNISYYPQQSAAENDENAISTPETYDLPSGFSVKTLWVRVENAQDNICFSTAYFNIIENPPVPISALQDTIVCSGYVLPPVEFGEYYSKTQGEGDHFNPGDIIDESGTYFIFNGPDENGCTNETSFQVIVIEKYDLSGTYCDHFKIPEPPIGDFYTAIDGPDGIGAIIPTGTVINTSQNIYYYAEVNESLCKNEPFAIDVHPLPPVDNPADVVTCDSYTLPPLQNGNYFTGSGGNGTALSAGNAITSSQTVYVFADDGTCANQNTFDVAIITDFPDVTACGSYILPDLEVGGYYTQSEGQGEQIPEGAEITNSQTLYFYAETTDSPNCTNTLSFDITIRPLPPVDSLDDVLLCEGDTFALPVLENGSYFTQSDRNGNQLHAGDVISSTQDIYINNVNDYCTNETVFSIIINPLPPIVNFVDIYSCDSYTVPEPTEGKIYTESNGGGDEVPPGQIITSTQTLYIYNQSEEAPYCENQQEFTVYVLDFNVGTFDDVKACESYTLPSLTEGNYFTKPNGEGQELHAGQVIYSSQTLYVYGIAGDRFTCESEADFDITISETPKLPFFDDIERCGSYTLPVLSNSDYNVDYYLNPDGQSKIDEVDYTFDEPGTYTIYVYATTLDNPNCYDEQQFQLTINPLRKLQIPDAAICVDVTTGEVLNTAYLNSGLNPSIFQVDWFLDGKLVHTGPDYVTGQDGKYTVETTKLIPDDGSQCGYDPVTIIIRKSSVSIGKANVTQDFSNIASIRVEILKGSGDYIFQLDDGPFQSENLFRDVKSGLHTVTIKDVLNVCGEEVINVQVVKHPKFFTPNNDGKNDRWNIKDLAGHPEAKIYIYDRYGKFITEIYPYSTGWDGNYNGRPANSADYWFKVTYKSKGQDCQYTSHFTLKRSNF